MNLSTDEMRTIAGALIYTSVALRDLQNNRALSTDDAIDTMNEGMSLVASFNHDPDACKKLAEHILWKAHEMESAGEATEIDSQILIYESSKYPLVIAIDNSGRLEFRSLYCPSHSMQIMDYTKSVVADKGYASNCAYHGCENHICPDDEQ